MKKFIYLLFLFLQTIAFCQEDNNNNKPLEDLAGVCYSKAIFGSKYNLHEMKLLIYLGDMDESIQFDTLFFKRKGNTNQLVYLGWSDDLNYLALSKNSEGVEKIVYVQNTTETLQVVEKTIDYIKLDESGAKSKWTEVLCKQKISKYLPEIQEALINRKYLLADNLKNTSEAFNYFQIDNNLPVDYHPLGDFNLLTLNALGINYDR